MKLLYMTMFKIGKSCRKLIFGPVKHVKFSRCLFQWKLIYQKIDKNLHIDLFWPYSVWYKTEFGSQNFGYQIYSVFFVIYVMFSRICSI